MGTCRHWTTSRGGRGAAAAAAAAEADADGSSLDDEPVAVPPLSLLLQAASRAAVAATTPTVRAKPGRVLICELLLVHRTFERREVRWCSGDRWRPGTPCVPTRLR